MQTSQHWRPTAKPTTAAAAAIAAFPPNPRPPPSNLSSIRRFPVANSSTPPKLSPPPAGYNDDEDPIIMDDSMPGPSTVSPAVAAAAPPRPTAPLGSTLGSAPHRSTVPLHPAPVYHAVPPPQPLDAADPRLSDLVTRLFVSSGIPLSAVTDPAFVEMCRHFNPNAVLPTETSMARNLEKNCKNPKPVVNYQKSLAPLCVTIDVADGTGDAKFLAYTIHYFEDLYERKNVVYLKKLLLSVCDADSVFILIRRAVNSYSYSNVKFANLVCPNPDMYKKLCASDIVKKYYVDFNFYIKKFALNLFKIEELAQGLAQFRIFCRYIKSNVTVYGKYRRLQLSKGNELNVPDVDDTTWYSTAKFLTHCLSLHDDFNDFCAQNSHEPPISNEQFIQLLYFQRLLAECLKHSAAVSQPDNSISQVMPTIMALRNYISMSKPAESYANHVRDAFTNSFSTVTRGSAKVTYDIATLMDPRYAYKTEIYNNQTWHTLEMRAIDDFVNMDPSLEKCYYNDVSLLTGTERHQVIAEDFKTYREYLGQGGELGARDHRLGAGESPNFWWGRRQTDMEYLAILAREYLATPATVINAESHFNKGKGKFDRIAKMYQRAQIDECLAVAGAYQEYYGKGHTREKDRITGEMRERLNAIENRLLSHGMHFMEQDQMMMEQQQHEKPVEEKEEQKPEAMDTTEVKVEPASTPSPQVPRKKRGIMRR